MARRPKQHRLVIEAIRSLADRQFSGWEITRRTGIPRTSVTRVMANLKEMGLLYYSQRGGYWTTMGNWARPLLDLLWVYEHHLWARGSRRRANLVVDKAGRA